jgi:dimethylaniline monooxygenase (N-oxide forming)
MIRREWMRRGVPPPDELWRRCAIAFDPATAPGVTSDELAPRIASGEIIVRPEIERFEGQRVRFADGSSAEPDAVILATGYELDFPFLPPDLRPWTDESSGLYRLVFSPRHVTLPFIGVCRVHGPILPIVEMQARWAARVLTGKTALPSLAEMRTEIAGRWQGRSAGSDALLRVTLLPYLDEIGAVIGVRPRWWRHTHLLGPLLAGPPVAAQYRLEGPHSWAGAPAVIRQAGAP